MIFTFSVGRHLANNEFVLGRRPTPGTQLKRSQEFDQDDRAKYECECEQKVIVDLASWCLSEIDLSNVEGIIHTRTTVLKVWTITPFICYVGTDVVADEVGHNFREEFVCWKVVLHIQRVEIIGKVINLVVNDDPLALIVVGLPFHTFSRDY
jgi:hypothetical protein